MLSLQELRAFAIERHGAQLYGREPYVVHLDDVHAAAQRHGLGMAYQRAAYGHDLLDDTETSLAEVIDRFGPEEGGLIYAVSGAGANRAARRSETLRRLAALPAGVDLKGVDRIANLAAALRDNNGHLVRMYLREQAAYAPLFEQATQSAQAEIMDLYTAAGALRQRGAAT